MTRALANRLRLVVSDHGAANTGYDAASVYRTADIKWNIGNSRVYEANMAPSDRDDLTDAKIAAAEARGETKITRLEGKIDTAVATLLGEMHAMRDDVRQSDQYNRDTRWVLFVTIITAAVALGGLAVGLATYGDALFGRGMSVRDVIHSVITEQQQLPKSPTTPQK